MPRACLLWLATNLLLACGYDASTAATPSGDRAAFEREVYPLLLRDCGFPACHGDPRRFLRVFGPGRTRLSADTPDYDPATADELDESLARARSMLRGVRGLADAPLLTKPLSVAAGGAGHEGNDGWGRNVYATQRDPAYQALVRWAESAGDAP